LAAGGLLSRTTSYQTGAAKPAAPAAKKDEAPVVVAENRKAGFDYHLLEHFEAGLVLLGTEVKAIREGVVNLRDSYVRIEDGEAFLCKVHIGQYSHSGSSAHDPGRTRKLLLNAHELRKLIGKTKEKGLTVVPTRMYIKRGRVKVDVALAKGKQAHDKRDTIKKREADRETRAAVKSRVR
jgi:SsrA-binding protein